MPTNPLSTQLQNQTYVNLFLVLGQEDLNTIWAMPNAKTNLESLVADTTQTDHVRFLAAEILFEKDEQFPPESLKSNLASLYARELALDSSLTGDIWGIPPYLNPTGRHVAQLGKVAVPELQSLLDNNRTFIFSGSQEATIGNAGHYRVKDFAAIIICEIRVLPYRSETNPASRDKAIEGLKRELAK